LRRKEVGVDASRAAMIAKQSFIASKRPVKPVKGVLRLKAP
jgi:hypothetical protein